MRRETSIFLEALRFFAAVFVFLAHFSTHILPTMPGVLGFNGREAVAIFFVLSGFVIRFVTKNKEREWRSYAVARISRISSVVIPAVALTMILDLVGRSLAPSEYLRYAPIDLGSLGALAASITFTNEVWFNHIILGSNEPYWSMGFEIWYYALFGVALYCKGLARVTVLLTMALLLGPKILLYMALWLLGVGLYDLMRRLKPFRAHRIVGGGLLLGSALMYVVAHQSVGLHVESVFRLSSLSSVLTSFGYFFFVAVLAASAILGFDMAFRDIDLWNDRLANAIRWLAGGSFTLYLTHQPLLLFWGAIFSSLKGQAAGSIVIAALTFASAYALAEVGERRKRWFRSVVDGILPGRSTSVQAKQAVT